MQCTLSKLQSKTLSKSNFNMSTQEKELYLSILFQEAKAERRKSKLAKSQTQFKLWIISACTFLNLIFIQSEGRGLCSIIQPLIWSNSLGSYLCYLAAIYWTCFVIKPLTSFPNGSYSSSLLEINAYIF